MNRFVRRLGLAATIAASPASAFARPTPPSPQPPLPPPSPCPPPGTIVYRDRGAPIRYFGSDPSAPDKCIVERGMQVEPEIVPWGIFTGIKDWPRFRAELCSKGESSRIEYHPGVLSTTARRFTWTVRPGAAYLVEGILRPTWLAVQTEEGTLGTSDSSDLLETSLWIDATTNVILFSRYQILRSILPVPKPDANWNAVKLFVPEGPQVRPPALCGPAQPASP